MAKWERFCGHVDPAPAPGCWPLWCNQRPGHTGPHAAVVHENDGTEWVANMWSADDIRSAGRG